MWRIVDIGGTNISVRISHNNMVAERDGEVLQSVPMTDINSIICHGDGNVYSDRFMRYCIENSIPLILCNEKHLPCGMFLAFNQNNLSATRIEDQVKASLPRKKNAWRQIIEAKLRNQAEVLKILGQKLQGITLSDSKKIKCMVPENGHVSVFYITDKQFSKIDDYFGGIKTQIEEPEAFVFIE